MFFEDSLLNELVEAGLELSVSKSGVVLNGFYKSGTVTLNKEDGVWVATARYNEKTYIESFDDLVYLNYKWWKYSDWGAPESKWEPFLVKRGLVKVTTVTVPSKTVTNYS